MEIAQNSAPRRVSETNNAVAIGFIINAFLAVLKTAVGVLGHSPALLADGINSTSDVAYYIVVHTPPSVREWFDRVFLPNEREPLPGRSQISEAE